MTSPPYGNRMADCFRTMTPKSMKGRYAGDLGRPMSAAALHFGPAYKDLMSKIYGALFIQMKIGSFWM